VLWCESHSDSLTVMIVKNPEALHTFSLSHSLYRVDRSIGPLGYENYCCEQQGCRRRVNTYKHTQATNRVQELVPNPRLCQS
jgi:hypothetical protein